MSHASRRLAGILLVVFPTVIFGGVSLLSFLVNDPAYQENALRQDLWRAGHAHAGVLLLLGLLCQLLADATTQTGFLDWLSRAGVPIAALLMPGGFFFASMGKDRTEPNGFIAMVVLGAFVLAAGLLSLGVGLLTA